VRYSQILAKNRRFNLPHLSLAPLLGVTPLKFRLDLWNQKTRRIALSSGVKNIAGRFFGLVTKHACDRRTDIQTDGQIDSQDRASIAASRGKNGWFTTQTEASFTVIKFNCYDSAVCASIRHQILRKKTCSIMDKIVFGRCQNASTMSGL